MAKVKMTSEDFKDWTKFRSNTSDRLEKKEIDLLVQLHAKYFNHKVKYPCTCSPKTYNAWIKDLNNIWENEN